MVHELRARVLFVCLVELTSDDRSEMLAAVKAIERSGRLSPVHALAKADFRLDGLRQKLEHGYAEARSSPRWSTPAPRTRLRACTAATSSCGRTRTSPR